MQQQAFDRTVKLLGEDAFIKLASAHVAVIGLGGVGGAALETLARAGVGKLTLVDGDRFDSTNLNRQILCTIDTVGEYKAESAARRVAEINPKAEATAITQFVNAENLSEILTGAEYCVDAIDDVKNKVALICECKRRGIYVVSAMGAGNRIDCEFTVTDIYKTKDDPFARKFRHELRLNGIDKLDVVCAAKPPMVKSGTTLSLSAPPFVMGGMLGGLTVRRIIGE